MERLCYGTLWQLTIITGCNAEEDSRPHGAGDGVVERGRVDAADGHVDECFAYDILCMRCVNA